MLASYLIHQSAAVRAAAEATILLFLTNRSGLRAPLVQIIAEMPVQGMVYFKQQAEVFLFLIQFFFSLQCRI